MQCHPVEAETQCDLSDFGLLGSVPGMQDYFVEDSGTWLIALQSESFAGAQASCIALQADCSCNGELEVYSRKF